MKRTGKTSEYKMPVWNQFGKDPAQNLAAFLLENTDSIFGRWSGHMRAEDQRKLFGRFLGKGRVVIDGSDETLTHTRKVAFGLDWDTTDNLRWRQLEILS